MTPADRTKIRSLVEDLLRDRDDAAPFSDSESLIQSGRLDSLAVTTIVMSLETEFGVDFTVVEFDPQRFDSVEAIGGVVDESRDRQRS